MANGLKYLESISGSSACGSNCWVESLDLCVLGNVMGVLDDLEICGRHTGQVGHVDVGEESIGLGLSISCSSGGDLESVVVRAEKIKLVLQEQHRGRISLIPGQNTSSSCCCGLCCGSRCYSYNGSTSASARNYSS